MSSELRTELQQRVCAGGRHVVITPLSDEVRFGDRSALAAIRPALLSLVDGGPFRAWHESRSAEVALQVPVTARTPVEVCREICQRVGADSLHLHRVEDDFERFYARGATALREATGLAAPSLSDDNVILCRHYASSVSRAYGALGHERRRLEETAVLVIVGLSACDGEPRDALHAWNWLVDFDRGTIASFEPQNEAHGGDYPNASALLYTLARIRTRTWTAPGVRSLIRSHGSLHGAMTLFHLARHPIARASRRAIVARLRAARFARVIPAWEEELSGWDGVWGDGVSVDDIVRYSDENG